MELPTLIAVVSDAHSGSTVGLMPPTWKLQNEGEHNYSATQRTLWGQWLESWGKIAEIRKDLSVKKKKPKLITVINGDPIDGNHHGTHQIITKDKGEQGRMFLESLDEGHKIAGFEKGDSLFWVQGTWTHTDAEEETMARSYTNPKNGIPLSTPKIKPTKPDGKDGRYVWDALKFEVYGKQFLFAHQFFSVGRKAWTKPNSMRSELTSLYYQYMDEKRRLPDVIVSSHFHNKLHATYEGRNSTHHGFVTSAFTTKTHYSYRVALKFMADVGMYLYIVYPNGLFDWKWFGTEIDEERVMQL